MVAMELCHMQIIFVWMFVRFTKSLVFPTQKSAAFWLVIKFLVKQLPFSSYPVLTWLAKCSKCVKHWQIFIWFCFHTCVDIWVKFAAVWEDLVLYIYRHHNLLNCPRDSIIPEPNKSYRQLLFVQGDHLKFILGDDLA